MIACIDNTVTSTKKFLMMPVLARHLYNEFCKNCDKRGAMAVEQFDDLVIISGASMLDKALLINQGYILYNEVEEKFYLDAYFHVHNRNLPKKYQRSNYSTLIDKNFFENPTTHILTKKVKVTTTSQVSTNKLIKSNLTQSQDLNIITSGEDVNTESAENEALRQSQNINAEHKNVNTESAENDTLRHSQYVNTESAAPVEMFLLKFGGKYSENDIWIQYENLIKQLEKRKNEGKGQIRNVMMYFETMLINSTKKKSSKKDDIPEICEKCDQKDTYPCVKSGKFEVYTDNGAETKPCPYAEERSKYAE